MTVAEQARKENEELKALPDDVLAYLVNHPIVTLLPWEVLQEEQLRRLGFLRLPGAAPLEGGRPK